ncbi:MAG: GNAT family N-acetyltransferase [Ilumatobacteraceae bacterium]|jgi:aminoglycoside 6'-N-acetyltransferase|nr:GNAT family N-acetyltransferase [Ilumatobacteraceae bacterium]MBP8210252.1 GNAT family N-acetyltransferase [Ilumatobacteraceae bacterium]HQY14477.1 GNAT family protein [Ilumatobacteraceae bacterium]HQY85758.1 GNAT family protein [Ilumatobacteraceae bacterium]HRA85386.1 GNAT family protein [Ilumatobacteraceae bacterium]
MPDVRLRPVQRDDLSWMVAMAADKEAVGEHNWCGAPDADELLGRLHHQFQCDGFLDRRGGRLVVLVDGEAIGDVSWRPAQWGPSEGSVCPAIGIALLPQFRGKGYGTIAQRLLADHLFREYGAHRVQSDTAADNPAEQRALEKAGFRREGIVRDAEERDGRFHDHVLYGLLREEWQAASAE